MMVQTFIAMSWTAVQTALQSPLMIPRTTVMMSWMICIVDVTMAEI